MKNPNAIVDYNSAKTFIDVSDQKKLYFSPIRKDSCIGDRFKTEVVKCAVSKIFF